MEHGKSFIYGKDNHKRNIRIVFHRYWKNIVCLLRLLKCIFRQASLVRLIACYLLNYCKNKIFVL